MSTAPPASAVASLQRFRITAVRIAHLMLLLSAHTLYHNDNSIWMVRTPVSSATLSQYLIHPLISLLVRTSGVCTTSAIPVLRCLKNALLTLGL